MKTIVRRTSYLVAACLLITALFLINRYTTISTFLGNHTRLGGDDTRFELLWMYFKADLGNAEAQYDLGQFFAPDTFYGRKGNIIERQKWLSKAAAQNHVYAIKNLSHLHQHSDDIRVKSPESAGWWLERAAKLGDSMSIGALATAYSSGSKELGIKKDSFSAAKWFRLSAESGNRWGMFNLGECYANGVGVPKDLVEAHAWLNLARALGYENEQNHISLIETQMTREQITEATKLSRERFERHKNK